MRRARLSLGAFGAVTSVVVVALILHHQCIGSCGFVIRTCLCKNISIHVLTNRSKCWLGHVRPTFLVTVAIHGGMLTPQ